MEIKRHIYDNIKESLTFFPTTAIIGPRQVGKTTLAKSLCQDFPDALYLDLERPSDQAKLEDAEFFLGSHQDRLVCLDEIQRIPELFPLMRSLIDENRRPGRFLILGSASPELLRQSSETLAGRIAFHHLNPMSLFEVTQHGVDWKTLLERGGFPESLLAPDSSLAVKWRENFILTFMERDLSTMGFDCNPMLLRRLWTMLAHVNGQVINYSKLAQALDVTHPTIKRYLDILQGTFMLNKLESFATNTKKRLVKAPKFYISDSGIFNTLLDLENFDELYNHPGYGSVWEGFAIQHIINYFKIKQPYGFFRTHSGDEIDLIFEKKGKRIGMEFKTSTTPTINKNYMRLITELDLEEFYVITPSSDVFTKFDGKVKITSLSELFMSDRILQRIPVPKVKTQS